MKSNMKKMELIQEKLMHLKAEQNEIEKDLIDMVINVLKINDAFQVDFEALVGGIVEAIETIRSDPVKREAWSMKGRKFCKTNIKSKHKRNSKIDSEMEKDHG